MLIFKINFEKYHYHTSIKLPINQHLQTNFHPHINIGINKKEKAFGFSSHKKIEYCQNRRNCQNNPSKQL